MQTILLTGISGYIALHCAAELLSSGYKVKGSVRNINKKELVVNTLQENSVDTKNLEFIELDLTDDKNWEQATTGIDAIMHIASPYHLADPKSEIEVIQPAVEGTLRVLKAAQRKQVKKVVITSSLVSMMGDMLEGTLTPAHWTGPDCKKINTYMKSKALAEKSAWDFVHQMGENKIELVTINPGAVIGPPLGKDISGQSMKMISQMLKGKMPLLADIQIPMIDVRDVAILHRKAIESSSVVGKRVIASHQSPNGFVDIAKVLLQNGFKGPSTRIAPYLMLKVLSFFDAEVKGLLAFVGRKLSADNSIAINEMNWEPIAFEQTVLDTAHKIQKIHLQN